MSRILLAFLLMAALVSCGRNYSAPRDLDNACSITDERPKYLRAMQATERKWGVPVPVQMAIIYQESKFIGNNRTPMKYVLGIIPMGRQSSAYGYAQALDGTWEEYQKEEGGRSSKRDKIQHATDFMGWYMTQTTKETGVPVTDAKNQYLAYHEGRAGYKRGSHNSKAWLLRVSDEVQARAINYDIQLRSCGKR
ncbi:transglycosylase SLT domain-containing protein [Maritimibacter sp. DP1N21-5]|uniref:transglycosylase SLT domain-containing protein n=1 Tax=Maritimibacter sp. DP1N21-5 TaxID=2836867 RepID=UPI001C476F64|nr:transglycosylase SLT domain-containing protein [Maritimibacter sp. DP1N21-5]MBV7408813.1 lytic transglycosylase [Maritimibacter sp. DP1N21-5]